MIVYLNGRFVPAEQASVSVFDRGFLYGDGLFESVRVYAGRPFLWESHVQRLVQGAAALHIVLPTDPEGLRATVFELLRVNHVSDAIVRISISRGPGPRGYSIRGANSPTLVITCHPAAPIDGLSATAWRLHTSRHRVPARDPVAAFKTTNKLTHILARAEAEAAGADEALLLNTDGHLAETSAANIFWLRDQAAYTPHLDAGGLAGVTRSFVLALLRASGWETQEVLTQPNALVEATCIFLTVSTLGIVEITHLDQRPVARDPRLAAIRDAYRKAIKAQVQSAGICD